MNSAQRERGLKARQILHELHGDLDGYFRALYANNMLTAESDDERNDAAKEYRAFTRFKARLSSLSKSLDMQEQKK